MKRRPLILTLLAIYLFYVAASAFAGMGVGLMSGGTSPNLGWLVPILIILAAIRVGIDLIYLKARWRAIYLVALIFAFQLWRWWSAVQNENRVVAVVALLNVFFLAGTLASLFSKTGRAAFEPSTKS